MDCLFDIRMNLPVDCIENCTESGDNYGACSYWVDRLNLNIPRKVCIKLLREQCAWEDEELEVENDREILIKTLWIIVGWDI